MKNIMVTTKEITILNNGEKPNGNCKAVFCITNGKIYSSVKEAAEMNNSCMPCVSLCCRGYRKSAKGNKYCFLNEMASHAMEISYEYQKKEERIAKVHEDELKIKRISNAMKQLSSMADMFECDKEEVN